jgi:GT2 family glycosyltransferase
MTVLSVVVPVYGQWALTEACLGSLARCTPGAFYQVIVVDNGSADETPARCPELLRALFGERGLHLRLEENLGFAAACNAGARAASGQHLLFLNNDTELTPGWPDPLFRALRDDPRLGAVSPLLLFPGSRRVQHLGVSFDPNLHPLHLFSGFPGDHPAATRPRTFQAVSAAALLLPRDLFLDLGGFHEGFRNGSEDLDLCCRLKRAGMRVACEPRSVVLHHTSRTEGRFDHVEDNARLLDQRCRGCFSSDLQRYAHLEGLRIRLTPWLEPYLAAAHLPPLAKAPCELADLLHEQPLHTEAHRTLVAHLQDSGDGEGALEWQELLCGFHPSVEHFSEAARLAMLTAKPDQEARWRGRLAHVEQLLAEPERIVERAARNRDWFRESGDRDMETLYRSWIDRRALQGISLPVLDLLRNVSGR